jgi:tripartite-type tricarboxylate transporter receptor subunit TctC
MRRRQFLTILGGAALMSPVTAGAVDTYPNRPIRLIVPYPPGGGTDIVGRLLGEKLILGSLKSYAVMRSNQ